MTTISPDTPATSVVMRPGQPQCAFSSIQPRSRIQFRLFFPKLEMKDCGIAVLCIGKDLSDRLAGTHLIACLHIDLAQVAIYRQIVTVADNDRIVISRNNEHTRHLTIEHGAGIRTRSGLMSIPLLFVRTYFNSWCCCSPKAATIVWRPDTG